MSEQDAPPVEDQPSTTPQDPQPDAPAPETPATPDEAPAEPTEEEQFRADQLAQAQAQNQTGDNAVPEQRPIASQQVDAVASPLTQRLQDEGALGSQEPMPKSAYDDAQDEARKSETADQGVQPAPHVGTVVHVKSGPHRGRRGAVLRVISYPSPEDRLAAISGEPSLRDYTVPAEIEISFRGDARDGERVVLDLNEVEWELIPTGFAGRGAVSGAL